MSGRFATQVMRLIRWISLSVLLGMAVPAQAVTVSGLYSVEVEVDGSSPEALREGYVRGLRQVLLRVSGTSEVLDDSDIQSLLDNAESYLQSYQYLGADEAGGSAESDRLRMSFGAVGVNRALAEANAPVWGANRPLTLAWIAVQDRGTRELVVSAAQDQAQDRPDSGSDTPWASAFRQAAAQRGVPLALPPEDFGDDRELLSDIWGQFGQRLEEASGALSYDLMSTVRVSRQGDEWRAAWSLEGGGLSDAGNTVVASTPEALATEVVGAWADMLAERYAVAAGDVGQLPQVEMVVRGVHTLEDYAQINRILADLTPVQRVGAARISGDRLELAVAFNGELEQLKQYVALDPRFVPVSSVSGSDMSPVVPENGEGQGEQPTSSSVDDLSGTESGPREEVIDPLFRYQPLLVEEEDSDEAFESLYQILHYRWEPAPGVVQEGDSGER